MQNLGYHDSIALEYVSKNDIDLTDYYTPEPESSSSAATPHELKTAAPVNKIAPSLTLQNLYDEFIEDRKTNNIVESSISKYRHQIGFLIELLKNKNACDVTKDDIRYRKYDIETNQI